MKAKERRITAIQALISGSAISTDPIFSHVIQDLNEVLSVEKVPQTRRRWLLQLLHSMRALDSSLQTFCVLNSVCSGNRSLGSYLVELTRHNHATLTQLAVTRKQFFQNNVVDKRNTYLHQAGSYPTNDAEILILISNMDSCLTEVLSL